MALTKGDDGGTSVEYTENCSLLVAKVVSKALGVPFRNHRLGLTGVSSEIDNLSRHANCIRTRVLGTKVTPPERLCG